MNFDFLDDTLWKPAGKGLSEADTFMKREMPFDSGWGAPAALVAAYFGGPAVMEAMGESAAGAGGAAEGGGMLGSLGGSSSAIDPSTLTSADTGLLDKLAAQNGVSQGDPSWLDNLFGNNEQGLYDQFNATNPNGTPKKSFGQEFGKQLMQNKFGSQMGQNMPQGYNEPPVQRQSNAFQFAPAAPIQSEKSDIAKLAALLRKKDKE